MFKVGSLPFFSILGAGPRWLCSQSPPQSLYMEDTRTCSPARGAQVTVTGAGSGRGDGSKPKPPARGFALQTFQNPCQSPFSDPSLLLLRRVSGE